MMQIGNLKERPSTSSRKEIIFYLSPRFMAGNSYSGKGYLSNPQARCPTDDLIIIANNCYLRIVLNVKMTTPAVEESVLG
jgi:hypothetical protein